MRQRKKKAVTRGRRGEGGLNQEVHADAAMIEGTDSVAEGESEEENAMKKLQEERDDRSVGGIFWRSPKYVQKFKTLEQISKFVCDNRTFETKSRAKLNFFQINLVELPYTCPSP